ncbi:unnamed protein product [Mytilus coruscus]|uniref:Caspase family p10 domain-containing protein n=1 Tax=Mytilus coruscus TaxID=42192 RepID=A0A6J8DIG3_MYTCO|nr:unnamed protein product [Mytilus coruscus]
MPVGGKQAVAEVMIFEHSKEKDLFFFPGLTDDMIDLPNDKRLQKRKVYFDIKCSLPEQRRREENTKALRVFDEAGEIHDCNGKAVQRNAILEIIRGCHHFEGKPKIVFVQTYNFQEKSKGFDSSDSKYDILKNGKSNTDDVFVVSNYPRIEQGPWILGENMSGSYFIQALIHVFKNFACEKSFMELLKEANMCMAHALVPKKTTEGNKKVTIERKTVAQIVLLEYCEGTQLYFFPGLDVTPFQKGSENKDVSESGKPVRAESNPH